jgi:hypothetical protein
VSLTAVSNKSCISGADFLSLQQNNADVFVPKNQPLENHETPLTHNNKHLLTSKAVTLDVLSLSRKFRNFEYDAVFQSRIAITQ